MESYKSHTRYKRQGEEYLSSVDRWCVLSRLPLSEIPQDRYIWGGMSWWPRREVYAFPGKTHPQLTDLVVRKPIVQFGYLADFCFGGEPLRIVGTQRIHMVSLQEKTG